MQEFAQEPKKNELMLTIEHWLYTGQVNGFPGSHIFGAWVIYG